MDLTTALDAGGGLVCVVGAGGKKSTLYALADRLDRAAVTATVRIPIFDDRVATVRVTDDPVAAVADAGSNDWPLGLVPGRDRSDRYQGYDPDTVDGIHEAVVENEGTAASGEAAPATLVKADGARVREFKAPGENEPQIPDAADVVVPIASAHVVGEPLSAEAVHRPERVADLTGLSLGEEIRPAHVGAVLASPDGGLKGVPDGATAIPVVNKVDTDAHATDARAIAETVLANADVSRVVLTRLVASDPVVEVVA
ncbi:putative selenium-dependent hydroxylase accessory protein YqeC [Halorubrum sp. CBA1125]|uniref:selenium cofactor biosynthesis protein YqeC n=1 Tax=Halorubrum sp. CBA1125 TaxID=2668072 RepID=UPI0012E8D8E6|nr:selenium cofactor biosynthesis protein YqeC [Halorubrum sp. CBA1125]MUW15513.1 putative selenium-dependent hydroxylase accessory protein YqeC [Halorubrum sp. CBA1125]